MRAQPSSPSHRLVRALKTSRINHLFAALADYLPIESAAVSRKRNKVSKRANEEGSELELKRKVVGTNTASPHLRYQNNSKSELIAPNLHRRKAEKQSTHGKKKIVERIPMIPNLLCARWPSIKHLISSVSGPKLVLIILPLGPGWTK